ncbi:MAG: type II toxin-antitoxin system RelE/ParE family toxin [Burkholderiales bacterium]
MNLVWTGLATRDRASIRQYVASDNPSAAIALDELLSSKAAVLLDHPRLGRPGRVDRTRELVVHRNYILVYDVSDDRIRTLRVLHSARQWPPADLPG